MAPTCERTLGSESLNSASTVLPRLLLLRISLYHALLNYYSLVELTSSAPAQLISKLDHKTPQLETTSLLNSSMSSSSPTEVFTTSNVFLDVLVKAGITHAFVKYVYLLAISSSNAANLPPFSASDPITLLYWKLSYQGRSTSYRLSRSSRVQMR